MLKDKTIILGVCGGIAAYKSCEIVSRLKDMGADVWVVMTKSAQEFVSPLTFRTLSTNPVVTNLFSEELISQPVPHISLSEKADLIIIAPATANIIGKIAYGIADDPLSTIIMSATCKKLIAPAMNNKMWDNPIVQENVSKLSKLGFVFEGPCEGKLACGDMAIGRMSEPNKILDKALELLSFKQDLKGKTILITAGGTRESIDPVRFIGNNSSGKMGYSIASAAIDRGAKVILISGKSAIAAPKDAEYIQTENTEQMHSAVMKNKDRADAIVMAAAVADYKPKNISQSKLKKSGKSINIHLEPTKDILSELGRSENGTFLVGFALETDDLIKNAKSKLKDKNLDLIVANDSSTINSDMAKVTLINRLGKMEDIKKATKNEVANKILDQIKLR